MSLSSYSPSENMFLSSFSKWGKKSSIPSSSYQAENGSGWELHKALKPPDSVGGVEGYQESGKIIYPLVVVNLTQSGGGVRRLY